MRFRRRREDADVAARDAIALLTATRAEDLNALVDVAYSLEQERLVGASITLAAWLLCEWEAWNPYEIDEYLQRLGLRAATADRHR